MKLFKNLKDSNKFFAGVIILFVFVVTVVALQGNWSNLSTNSSKSSTTSTTSLSFNLPENANSMTCGELIKAHTETVLKLSNYIKNHVWGWNKTDAQKNIALDPLTLEARAVLTGLNDRMTTCHN